MGIGGGTRSVFRDEDEPLEDPIPNIYGWPVKYRRDDLEHVIWGYPRETYGRPVYGAMNIGGNGLGEIRYGTFVIVLDNDEIKEHSTILYGDSLQNFVEYGADQTQSTVQKKFATFMNPMFDEARAVKKINYHASD